MSLTAKLVLSPVLVAQAIATRARLPRLPEPAGPRQGVAGRGTPLRLLITGDSSAAGVGVGRQHDALASRLAKGLAEAAGARVAWRLSRLGREHGGQLVRRLRRRRLCAPRL
jgi:hypothetical protein